MSAAKHTPGPWRVSPKGYVAVVADSPVGTHSDTDNILAYGGSLVCESICTEANAALISAAPELLEALKAFAEIHDNSPDNTPWGCGLTNGHFFRAKEAISKAEGRE